MKSSIIKIIILIATQLATIIKIRLIGIRSNRIGHFIADSIEQIYFYNEKQPVNTIDIFYFEQKPINLFWAKKVEEQLPIRILVPRLLGDLKSSTINIDKLPSTSFSSRDSRGFAYLADLSTKFSDSEKADGEEALLQMGLKSDQKLVVILLRDSSYLEAWAQERGDKTDFSYHSHRDVDPDRYKKGILWLLSQGYSVLRMGRVASKPLDINHPRFYDYAFSDSKSDFLDIYIFSNASLVISNGSGLDCLAHYNRNPMMLVDFIPVAYAPTYAKCFVYPKTIRRRSDGRLLNFHEHLEHSYIHNYEYKNNNLFIENLSEEQVYHGIRNAVRLLVDRSEEPNSNFIRLNKLAVDRLIDWDKNESVHHFINQDFYFDCSWLSRAFSASEKTMGEMNQLLEKD